MQVCIEKRAIEVYKGCTDTHLPIPISIACDAYSLLEVYDVLVSQDNDFAKEMAAPAPIKTMPKASVLYSPVSPLSTEPTGMKMDLPETSPSQAAASSSLDLIQL